MSTPEELFEGLKFEIAALAEPLFEFSEQCLRERGNFLPHGAIRAVNAVLVVADQIVAEHEAGDRFRIGLRAARRLPQRLPD